MSCSPDILKDYVLGELSEPERAQVETHVLACADCRSELDSLNLTRAALLSVADQEPPRRIAFVSDKVFEPRWWQRLWASGPQLGFAAAAMLAVAIVVHGFMMPPANATAPAVTAAATVDPAVVEAEVARRVEAEVAKVVAASEERQLAKTLELVNVRLREVNAQRRDDLLLVRDYLERLEKQNSTMIRRAAYE